MININQDKKNKIIIKEQIQKAKVFLEKTNHKISADYTLKENETLEDIEEIKETRAEAIAFIRANK